MAFAKGTPLQSVALKAYMVFQVLMLQKPSPRSKSKDHCLTRRMELWTKGELDRLINECQCIQSRLLGGSRPPKSNEQISRYFRHLVLQGKSKAALQYLFQDEEKGVSGYG